MSLEEDKTHILTGVYNAKEVLFFIIGIGTLIAIPFLDAGRAGTWQLVILGAVLTLEGFSSVVEIIFDFMIKRGLPWIDQHRKDKDKKRKAI